MTVRSASGKKSARRPVKALVEAPKLEALSSPVLGDNHSNKHLSDISSAVINDTRQNDDMSVVSDSVPVMSAKKAVNMSLTGFDNSVAAASPDLMQYLPGSANNSRRKSRVSLIRPQKSCSPSPLSKLSVSFFVEFSLLKWRLQFFMQGVSLCELNMSAKCPFAARF